MHTIRQMEQSDTYEVMDLWLRSTTKANPFIEDNFWTKHYDKIKNKLLRDMNCFLYIENNKIMGFLNISSKNRISGLYVDPEFENRGVGSSLIEYAKTEYALLQINVYAKNKNMLRFCTHRGFLIDGALLHPDNGQVQYTMIWSE